MFDDLLEDQEVDGDRRVVLRDAGLLRDLHAELTEVNCHGALDRRREQEHEARAFRSLESPQEEDHEPLIFRDDVDDRAKHQEDDDREEDRDERTKIH